MNQFIIATHSELAEGFYKAVKLFKDDCENVHYINAYVKNNEFERELIEKINELSADNLIIFTDMKGGSVNRKSMELIGEYGFILISGINLPLILELVFLEEDVTLETVERCIKNAKDEVICLNNLDFKKYLGGN